jgi:hypothetical protein
MKAAFAVMLQAILTAGCAFLKPARTPMRKIEFAPTNHLVADVLPKNHMYLADGGHDWPAWKAVWANFLDTQTFWPKADR